MVKKITHENSKRFLNYTTSPCIMFNPNVPILQNVPISPNCILPTYSLTKCFNTSILYTTDQHFYYSSVKIGSISFFSSSRKHQSNPIIFCDATLLALIVQLYFFKCFAFFKFNMLDKKLFWLKKKLEQFARQKIFFLIVIKITVFFLYN